MIDAQIIRDSVSPEGKRLTTFQLRYPRIVHSELMTHRLFSRNASSSRAIPIQKVIDEIRRDPAMPVAWTKNQPGMQGRELLTGVDVEYAKLLWLCAAESACAHAEDLARIGLHKQVVNRVTEPYQHIAVIVTATNFANWFTLRRHTDADPTIQALADAMWRVYQDSEPDVLQPGQWHLPYITERDFDLVETNVRLTMPELIDQPEKLARACLTIVLQCSAARCARVSYKNHDGSEPSIRKDMETFKKLDTKPLHASALEHQATPDALLDFRPYGKQWAAPHTHGNFDGWIQFRKLQPGECATEYDPAEYDNAIKEAA